MSSKATAQTHISRGVQLHLVYMLGCGCIFGCTSPVLMFTRVPCAAHAPYRSAQDAYLGLLGPIIRAEVGDVIQVVFKNSLRFPGARGSKGKKGGLGEVAEEVQ